MNEREIDLIDLLADVLSHWRGILAFMLIGAVLLGGFSYAKSYWDLRQLQGGSKVSEDANEAETGRLTEAEKMAVYAVLNDEQEYLIDQQYVNASVVMQMDPYHIPRSVLLYKIQMDDMRQSYMLRSVYEDLLNGVDLLQWVEKQTGISAASADELISALGKSNLVVLGGAQEAESIDIGNDCLKVVVTHSDENECKKLTQCVKDYLEQQHEQLVREFGAHEMILVSESQGVVMDMTVRATQQQYSSNAIENLTNCAKAKEAFTASQKAYYDLLKEGEKRLEERTEPVSGVAGAAARDEENLKPATASYYSRLKQGEELLEEYPELIPNIPGTAAQDEENGRPVINKKYVVIGAVLFAFLYAGVIFVLYILNGKIRTSDELQELYNISQLGLIVKNEGKKQFFLDRWVAALKNWHKRQFTREQSLELAAAAIRISAGKQALDEVCLMGCDLKAGADAVCQEFKERLEKEHLKVKILDNVLYDAEALAKLESVKGIVLVEKVLSTLYDEIQRELELASRQGIPVLGGVIVE